MTTFTRALGTTAALAATGAVLLGASAAPGESGHAAAVPKKITPHRVGAVKLGKTFRQLHAAGLVGKLRKGCELAGPKERFAKLRSPLRGTVDFTQTSPREARDIVVTGGATARGVGVGDTLADITAAFPKAKVDHGTDATFGLTLVSIPKNGGGKMAFTVSTTTHKITLIGVPFIPFCD